MPHTVVVDGTELTVGKQTTVATLRKVAGIPQEATVFYRANGVIHLLHDTETVVERVPDETVIEFHPGQIGPGTEFEPDDTGHDDTEDDAE